MKENNIQIRNSTTDFLVFTKQAEEDGIEVRVHDENVWLTQKSMAELFDCSTDNIGLHLKNIFNEGELEKDSVTEKSSATALDGKNYLTTFYNLDAIISVGYRVNLATHDLISFLFTRSKTKELSETVHQDK
ncbi:MAG: phosphoribosylaminoimidazolesuccinocarboxamide synthase [Oscillospiraceae bacterium]